VAQEVDVELELLPRRGYGEHLVVELLKGGPKPEETEAGANAGDVGVNRDVGEAVGEEQDAGRRLAPDAGQRTQKRAALLERGGTNPLQGERVVVATAGGKTV
jgi:hypothetical protein